MKRERPRLTWSRASRRTAALAIGLVTALNGCGILDRIPQDSDPSPRPAPEASRPAEPVATSVAPNPTPRAHAPESAPIPGATAQTTARTGASPSPKNYNDAVVLSELRERAVSVIESAARDPDAEVRANAMEAAGKLGSRLDTVVAIGLNDDNPAVKAVAAMTIGRAKLARLAPAAAALLKDESPYVRAAGIFAMARNNEPVDQTPLASMLLNDPNTKVRAHAAFILGELGNPSAAPMLRSAYGASASRASRIDTLLLQLQISEALIKLTDDRSALESVRAALYSSRPEELEATALAVQILGQVRDRGATDHLIYMSAYKDSAGNELPAEIRLGIAAALARMDLAKGAFMADQYVNSDAPAIRAQSAFVYGETSGRENLARLEQLLQDPDTRVRVSAANGVLTFLQHDAK